MSSNYAIKIDNLSKQYQLFDKPSDRLKQILFRGHKQYYREFNALQNINFEIAKGETVGIVGRNGSGKSTLLQIIAGTLSPSNGKIQVNGRVAALLELGSGFNPEFTGRENVYLNGAILGISKAEMDERFDDIIQFADIGSFIDQPVKTYSSGMYVRLAFSIAINVEADILIVDEALAVGDTKFQIKCIDKMKEIKKSGTTILFVSHAGEQVKRFCEKGIWLENGQVKEIGKATSVVNHYEDSLHMDLLKQQMEATKEEKVQEISKNQIIVDMKDVEYETPEIVAKITNVSTSDIRINTFDKFSVVVEYEIYHKEIPNFLLGVAIYGSDRKYIFGPNTHLDKYEVPNTIGKHQVKYFIPSVPLMAGSYFVDVGVFVDGGLVCLDYKNEVKQVHIESEYFSEGLVYIQHEWSVIK
ncbi:ABC transporter ATP-binding protein [Lysinibacillus capsici]|uniref:ABC transporter ATP-binding protein n=2 Tax=Lysinibacillus TaxID=400634 RepID=UPI0021A81F25|nr:ABC transporter ATP-binding protein [Lysinibacillus capsici]MCT1539297.1 ABC transporter ATP-binding protein [Lysinibacillus capsici]MCT1570635.1 ABC transporter ATP-binding protein [Lysinibacillus capsici]MCT1647457.1 ABC transporter ATP-binding protein [Lysinibacillus capsici]MCT1726265.1 ABC transporter ATP-binding protein [Lysinibacillus capsici]MCT1783369.1 ABC transporter ATP-binding protein [Lysinibacillus capsici]